MTNRQSSSVRPLPSPRSIKAPENNRPEARNRAFGPSGGSRVSDGDGELMRVLHDEHATALRSYVLGLTSGDRHRAEDVVQETMLRAWSDTRVLDQSNGSARGWLRTVARRILIDEWRAGAGRREVVTDTPPELPTPDGTELAADRSLVVQALSRLSAEHREVLLECYLRESSVAEAATKLAVPAGTVKSRTHYALRAFKLALAEMGGPL